MLGLSPLTFSLALLGKVLLHFGFEDRILHESSKGFVIIGGDRIA